MARVDRPRNKGKHEFLVRQEQAALGKGKDRKVLAPVSQTTADVKMAKTEKRETRREKFARKTFETKKLKAPVQVGRKNRMDVDDKVPVKKTAGIHK